MAAEGFINFGNGKALLNGPLATTIIYLLASLFGTIVMSAIFGISSFVTSSATPFRSSSPNPLQSSLTLAAAGPVLLSPVSSSSLVSSSEKPSEASCPGRPDRSHPRPLLVVLPAVSIHRCRPDIPSRLHLLSRRRAHTKDHRRLSTGHSHTDGLLPDAGCLRLHPAPSNTSGPASSIPSACACSTTSPAIGQSPNKTLSSSPGLHMRLAESSSTTACSGPSSASFPWPSPASSSPCPSKPSPPGRRAVAPPKPSRKKQRKSVRAARWSHPGSRKSINISIASSTSASLFR